MYIQVAGRECWMGLSPLPCVSRVSLMWTPSLEITRSLVNMAVIEICVMFYVCHVNMCRHVLCVSWIYL